MKYKHDTFYYGGEIITAITKTLNRYASLDRGGTYIWAIPEKDSSYIVYYNNNENNYRGSLEIHKDRNFLSQIDYNGVLDLNEDKTDCVLNTDKIVSFLTNFKDGVLLKCRD